MLINMETERVRNKLSRKELADLLDVSVRTYSNWIKEKRDIPSRKLQKLSIILGVSMEQLLENESQCPAGAPGIQGKNGEERYYTQENKGLE